MLGLAARLDDLPREALLDGLRRRRFDGHGVDDVFDLAEALLSNESIDQALEPLDRPTLAVLAAAAIAAGPEGATTLAAVRAELERLGAGARLAALSPELLEQLDRCFLIIADGDRVTVPAPVAHRLATRLDRDLPPAEALAASHSPVLLTDERTADFRLVERRAAETAYATVSRIAEMVVEFAVQPARELAKGGLALPDAKRLAESAGIALEEVAHLVAIAQKAGLVVREGAEWLETTAGADWLTGATTERWRSLAAIWRAGITPQLLELAARRGEAVSAATLLEDVRWFYPAGGDRLMAAAEGVLREADTLGITVAGDPSPAGRLVLAGELDEAAAAMAALFPRQVDRVYVQHDLTIVSPGPLAPEIDAGLRAFAEIEGRDLASSYRVTAASVNRALASGRSASSIRAFLEEVSLTGIPQPLAYLIEESAGRFGSIRVAPAAEADAPARTIVHSTDPQLLRTLQVDHTLAAVGLLPAGDGRLGSRFGPDVVFWALADARYPVAAEDASGQVIRLRRERVARPLAVADLGDPLAQLVDRVREASGQATEAAWLARQLEAAARAKETLTVSVRMPGGELSDYLLAPSSVANGRLRARDRRADIERTLPLSAIASVGPAPAGLEL